MDVACFEAPKHLYIRSVVPADHDRFQMNFAVGADNRRAWTFRTK